MSAEFDPHRVDGILFDIDGTLADTDDIIVEKIANYLNPLTKLWPNLPARRWARWLLMKAETPMNFIYAWWDRTYLDELTAPLFGLLPKRRAALVVPPLLVPGVREMLEALRPHYRMAVVTARSEHQGHQLLLAAEIDHYFETVVTTRSVRRAKPHPAPVRWAAEQLGLPVDRCLMVGDTTLDVRAGQAAGAQTVAVLCGLGEEPELARLDPSLLLEKTSDLVDHLPPSDRPAR
ncbi:MAG: HAD family hydrolase [Anaerolineales bacterium]